MRDRIHILNGVSTPVADLPTPRLLELAKTLDGCQYGGDADPGAIRDRIEIELIARSRDWPTKRIA